MDQLTCPIWITRADSVISVGDAKVIDSPRAGGKYKITNTALALISNLKAKETTKITNWLIEQRMLGFEIPTLNSESLMIAKNYRLFSVSEMVDRALIWLSENVDGLGKHVPLGTHIPNYLGYEVLASYTQSLSAATGSAATHEVIELLEFSAEEGWVTSSPERKKNEGGFFSLTFRGHQRAESLKNKQASERQVFVAMWFSTTMDEAYVEGFAKGITEAGYLPVRIDRKEHNNKIDDEIIAEIRRSRFVVADFTSEIVERQFADGKTFKDTHARGGVYFEAGFAKGLGKEVIWTVREDVLPFVHFDTRQFAHIVWKDSADLCAKLEKRISSTLGDGPLKG